MAQYASGELVPKQAEINSSRELKINSTPLENSCAATPCKEILFNNALSNKDKRNCSPPPRQILEERYKLFLKVIGYPACR